MLFSWYAEHSVTLLGRDAYGAQISWPIIQNKLYTIIGIVKNQHLSANEGVTDHDTSTHINHSYE